MIDCFNIQTLVRERADQRTFHVVSERYVRIEYRNLMAQEAIGPFAYEGDIVVTCYRGEFTIHAAESHIKVAEFDQAVVPRGTTVKILCNSTGTLQMIWSPAHAATTQG